MQRLLIPLALCLSLATCVPSTGTCVDGLRNGDESDVDCGGACATCEVGQVCLEPSDCQSAACARGVCAGTSCRDGKLSGDESAVDCGGACPGCADGPTCRAPADCASGVCTAGVCAAGSCADQIRNGAETDVDCGGPRCAPCPLSAACLLNVDCALGACVDGTCVERCALPLLSCGPMCVDPRFDPGNCGGCGVQCDPGHLRPGAVRRPAPRARAPAARSASTSTTCSTAAGAAPSASPASAASRIVPPRLRARPDRCAAGSASPWSPTGPLRRVRHLLRAPTCAAWATAWRGASRRSSPATAARLRRPARRPRQLRRLRAGLPRGGRTPAGSATASLRAHRVRPRLRGLQRAAARRLRGRAGDRRDQLRCLWPAAGRRRCGNGMCQ